MKDERAHALSATSCSHSARTGTDMGADDLPRIAPRLAWIQPYQNISQCRTFNYLVVISVCCCLPAISYHVIGITETMLH